MKPLLLPVLFGLTLTPIVAQTALSKLPPLPPGPLPAHLERAQWTVTIGPDQPDSTSGTKTSPAQLTNVAIIKDGSTRKIVIQAGGNPNPFTYWCLGGRQYYHQEDGLWIPVDKFPSSLIATYQNSDFPECKSVNRQNYTSTSKVNNRPCFVFNRSVQIISEEELRDQKQINPNGPVPAGYMAPNEVYLDMATALPLKTHFNGHFFTYVYSPNPDPISPPPDLLRILKAQQQLLQDLSRTPPHA